MSAAATFLCEIKGVTLYSETGTSLEGSGCHGAAAASLQIFPLPWGFILPAAAGQKIVAFPGSVTSFCQSTCE